jgi:hypothetical protein
LDHFFFGLAELSEADPVPRPFSSINLTPSWPD